MKLYEYQAKLIFEQYGIPKPDGKVAETLASLPQVLKKMGKGPWAVKAQILAGGRGKAGGVKIVKTPVEAKALAKKLFAKPLVTHQTGPAGEKVIALLVEKTQKKIAKEMDESFLALRL